LIIIDKKNPSTLFFFKMTTIFFPLHIAILQNDLQAFQTFLELIRMTSPTSSGTYQFINQCDPRGNTALHCAASMGVTRLSFVRLLVAYGSDVNYPNEDGETALFGAVRAGDLATIVFLCESGADVNTCSMKESITPLHLAALVDRSDIIEALLRFGASVFNLDDEEETPLHYAAREDKIQSSQTLIAAIGNSSALIHFKNADGETAFDFALCFGHHNLIQLFSKYCNHSSFDNFEVGNDTPVSIECKNGSFANSPNLNNHNSLRCPFVACGTGQFIQTLVEDPISVQ